jgi:quercetin dioxygenase-like cupin family protein
MNNTNDTNEVDDVVAIAPHIHQVMFENDTIRVLKVTVKPGDKVGMHRNPENINYILKPGKLRFTNPDGSTQDVELTDGQVIPAPESSHAVENIGDTEMQSLGIELKK